MHLKIIIVSDSKKEKKSISFNERPLFNNGFPELSIKFSQNDKSTFYKQVISLPGKETVKNSITKKFYMSWHKVDIKNYIGTIKTMGVYLQGNSWKCYDSTEYHCLKNNRK